MEPVSRHRLRWWLRGERALGLRHVFVPGGAFIEPAEAEAVAVPQQNRNAAAREALGTAEGRHATPPIVRQQVETPRPGRANNLPPATFEQPMTTPAPAAAWFGNDAGLATAPAGPFTSPELSPQEKAAALAALDAAEVKGCVKCPLHRTRRNTVYGEGDPNAELMFVGEGPGMNEDATGRPFVGRAGEKLTEMIEKGMKLGRSQVYITNVVKCRAFLPGPPPKDRPPQPDEAATCMPYLHRQIEIVRPRVIVTLGLSASQYLLGVKQSMSRMRGNWHAWRGIPVMPTFHPSYVLRNYTPETRRAVWEDLKQVIAKLQEVRAGGRPA